MPGIPAFVRFDTIAAEPRARSTAVDRAPVSATARPAMATARSAAAIPFRSARTPSAQTVAAWLARSSGGHLARAGDTLLQLQRLHGNQHVRQVVSHTRRAAHPQAAPVIQTSLILGSAADRAEREADRVARQAMALPAQRAPDAETGTGGAPTVQRVPSVVRPSVVGPGAAGGVLDPMLAQAIHQARGAGRAVPGSVRERMEQALGADLGGVRIHTDARADRLNEALRSRAFTVGADVFVRRSEYRPGSPRSDALLAHELTHTAQQGAVRPRSSPSSSTVPGSAVPGSAVTTSAGAIPAGATPTVQCKFGFEFELGVPLTAVTAGVRRRPRANPYPVVGHATDDSFEAHIDHSARLNNLVSQAVRGQKQDGSFRDTAILELVTQPMDEFTMTENDVRTIMQGLVDVADHIKTNAIDQNDSIPVDGLPGLVATPPGVNFVGIQAANPILARTQTVDAYVQQTYGLSLKRVAEEFDSRATQPGSRVAEENKTALNAAGRHADDMVRWIRDHYGRRKHKAGGAKRSFKNEYGFPTKAELDEAHGLFALIAYYLEVGKINPHVQELIKKKVGIFYFKTRLSTVRNQVTAADPKLKWLFKTRRGKLVTQLLHLTNRQYVNDKVIAGSGIDCGPWVDAILAGQDDLIFNRSVNPYSRELTAPALGHGGAHGVGVVMENRKFAATEGKNEVMGKYAPNTWPQLAVNLHRYLRDRQGF